jgi:hypothetical protein
MFTIITALLLLSFACTMQPVSTQGAATVNRPTHVTTTPTPERVTITGNVYVRTQDGRNTGYWIARGSQIAAECRENWCYIVDSSGKFWRGCCDENPEGLGCR